MGEKRSVSRKERVPLTGLRQKLHVADKYKKPGYKYHWFNDTGSKLYDAEQAWWSFVQDPDIVVGPDGVDGKDKLSTKIRKPVGTRDNGAPIYTYLMKIGAKYYNEDMAEQKKHLDSIDNSIRRGANVGGEPGQDGKYIPAQGIVYENKLG